MNRKLFLGLLRHQSGDALLPARYSFIRGVSATTPATVLSPAATSIHPFFTPVKISKLARFPFRALG